MAAEMDNQSPHLMKTDLKSSSCRQLQDSTNKSLNRLPTLIAPLFCPISHILEALINPSTINYLRVWSSTSIKDRLAAYIPAASGAGRSERLPQVSSIAS